MQHHLQYKKNTRVPNVAIKRFEINFLDFIIHMNQVFFESLPHTPFLFCNQHTFSCIIHIFVIAALQFNTQCPSLSPFITPLPALLYLHISHHPKRSHIIFHLSNLDTYTYKFLNHHTPPPIYKHISTILHTHSIQMNNKKTPHHIPRKPFSFSS